MDNVSRDTLWLITSFLSHRDVTNLKSTCRLYQSLFASESFWRYYFRSRYADLASYAHVANSFTRSWKEIVCERKFILHTITWEGNKKIETPSLVPVVWQDRSLSMDIFHRVVHDDMGLTTLPSFKKLVWYHCHVSRFSAMCYIDKSDNFYYYVQRRNVSTLIMTNVRLASCLPNMRKTCVLVRKDNTLWYAREIESIKPNQKWQQLDITLPATIIDVLLYNIRDNIYLHVLTSSNWLYVYHLDDDQTIHLIHKQSQVLAFAEYNGGIFIFKERGQILRFGLTRQEVLWCRKRTYINGRCYIRCLHNKLFSLHEFLKYQRCESCRFLREIE